MAGTREERLEAALRANLLKRKAQERARDARSDEAPETPSESLDPKDNPG